MYPNNVNEVQFNLLDSHDTPRILTICDNNKEKVKLLYLFQLSFLGTPCLYYGDEIGMTGSQDPGCRKCMIWEEDKQDRDLFEYVAKLIDLRKNIPAFGNSGTLEFVETNDKENYIIYKKTNQNESIYFIINNSEDQQTIALPAAISTNQLKDIWSEKKIESSALSLEPFGFKIIGTK